MNPFKLYAKSQEVQLNWIRNHPVQWIAVNAILFVVFIGFVEWKDRKEERKFEKDLNQETNLV